MSIEDRGRVFVELLLVAIVFVWALGHITPWKARTAVAMNAIEQWQIAHNERPSRIAIQQEEAFAGLTGERFPLRREVGQ